MGLILWGRITTGAVKTTDEEKKRFAAASHAFNIANRKFRVSAFDRGVAQQGKY